MPDYENYKNALKLGERSYKEHLSRGEYPYLQVLDEQLKHTAIVSENNLGLKEIPMDAIIGTRTAARRTAFAPNFMPLLSRYTEFAGKWASLCDAHLKEGIHDPIKVYEYMNHYYVLEGNKRVSVLKYFGARSVPAYVTRLIPQRSELKENRVYFEFLEFTKTCPADFLLFTEPGSYREFLEYAGKEEGEVWTGEELSDLRSSFIRFEAAYRDIDDETLKDLKPSDAYLCYLKIYPYRNNLQKTPAEYREDILKIRDEMRLSLRRHPVKLIMDADESKPGFFDRIFGPAGKVLRIAFVYAKTPASSSWTYGHELGRLDLQEYFEDEIETKACENVDLGTIDATLEQIVAEGFDMIFVTTPVFLSASLKAAVRHPEVHILNCAVNTAHRYIRTYYGRIYEAKFLSGLIAGTMTDNDTIGYLSDYPIAANLANLNAFALGVQTVNPRARVHIQWTSVEGADPESYFAAHDIRIISGKELSAPDDPNREFGLYRLTEQGHENLAMTVWNWGILYRKLVESIRSGVFGELGRATGRALNYWWGMDSDVIDLFCSKNVPQATKRLLEFMKTAIRNGEFHPFSGRITAKDRIISDDENSILSPIDIASIDWLNENITGDIPDIVSLNAEGREIMAVQGSLREDD